MILALRKWPNAPTTPLPADAPTLVLLHGMGGTAALWRPIAAQLEHAAHVWALDQRGHGGSQPPRAPGQRALASDYTPLAYGQDVVETLAHELASRGDAAARVWLVGHSMGVRTAVAVAHLAPERIAGLVLVDLGLSGPAGGGLGRLLESLLVSLPEEFASRRDAQAYLAAHAPDPAIGLYLLAVAQSESGGGRTRFPFDRQALIATLEAARGVDSPVRSWLHAFASRYPRPVYLLRGETSRVWSRDEFEQERQAAQAYPQLHWIEVAGTGHGLPFEKRAWFGEQLIAWTRPQA